MQAGSAQKEETIQEDEAAAPLSSAPSAPATQFPSQEPPASASRKLRGKALWSRHVRQMSLARVLIRHMQSDDDDGTDEEWDEDGDLSDISACENLLESYFAQASGLLSWCI